MEPLLSKRGLGFKSPLTVIILFLWRSRETCRRRWRQLREELNKAKRALARSEEESRRKDRIIQEEQRQIERLRIEKEIALKETRLKLPDDPPVGTHGYGDRMVSLAVKLARNAGLRGSEGCMKTFFDWLGVEQKVPHHTSIRTWMQRIGVAELAQVEQFADAEVFPRFFPAGNRVPRRRHLPRLRARWSRRRPIAASNSAIRDVVEKSGV